MLKYNNSLFIGIYQTKQMLVLQNYTVPLNLNVRQGAVVAAKYYYEKFNVTN